MAENDATDPTTAADAQLLAEIRTALGPDPMPATLLDACEQLLTWVGVDDELTQLLAAGELAGVRSGGLEVDDPAAPVTYAIAGIDVSAEIVVEAAGGEATVRGTVYGADVTAVELEALHAGDRPTRASAELDALGDFRFDAVPRGIVRVRIEAAAGSAATEWFIV